MNSFPPASSQALKIGYVLEDFHRLSKPQILDEILELEHQDVEVEIFLLCRQTDSYDPHVSRHLRATVIFLPSGGGLGQWFVDIGQTNGALAMQRIVEPLDSEVNPGQALIPGKTSNEIATLGLQALTLSMLVLSRGIDHMHAHSRGNATTAALLASRISRIPFSYTVHAQNYGQTKSGSTFDAPVQNCKIAEASFVIAASDHDRLQIVNLGGDAGAGKIHRVYNGIDLKRFRPDNNIHHDKKLIVSLGRLVELDGLLNLTEACRQLKEQHTPFRCLIAGQAPQREQLQRKIDSLGLTDDVVLLGDKSQEQILKLMKRARLLALPFIDSARGDRDGLARALLEATAMGVPSVATKVPGATEIIKNCGTGFLAPPGDPVRLAKTMALMLTDDKLRNYQSEAGRKTAERYFCLKKNAGLLKSYFEESTGRMQRKHRKPELPGSSVYVGRS